MLPSQLKENECIQIRNNTGCIEFHRDYGALYVIAKNTNSECRDSTGLLIAEDNDELADKVYTDWHTAIQNRNTNQFPKAGDDATITYYAAYAREPTKVC